MLSLFKTLIKRFYAQSLKLKTTILYVFLLFMSGIVLF